MKRLKNALLPLSGVVLLAGVGFGASPEQCNLAVVSQRLSSKQRVCDSRTVEEMAKHGHVYAQNQLGLASILILGPEYRQKDAFSWFLKAAQRGYAPAQVNAAILYAYGWGIPKNIAAAQLWLREAASQHYGPAYFNLGQLYLQGLGVRQDNAEALRFFRLGAEAGDSYAQTNLAYMYDRGLGVARDVDGAARWYRRAADSGNPMAQNNLADMYAHGDSVPSDETMAFHFYRKAAEQGHTGAQIQIAYRLAEGIGTTKDLQQALAWVTAAVNAGDNRGQELLRSLRAQLKSGDVERATAAAAELRANAELASRAAMFQE